MKDFDIVIIGGGCSGLSLAFQLEINSKLKGRSLAIIDNRDRYFRDKTWSFWKVNQQCHHLRSQHRLLLKYP